MTARLLQRLALIEAARARVAAMTAANAANAFNGGPPAYHEEAFWKEAEKLEAVAGSLCEPEPVQVRFTHDPGVSAGGYCTAHGNFSGVLCPTCNGLTL